MSSSKSPQEMSHEQLVSKLILATYDVSQFQGTDHRFPALADQEEFREEILRRMATPAPAPLPASGIYQVEWIDAHTAELTILAICEEARYVK